MSGSSGPAGFAPSPARPRAVPPAQAPCRGWPAGVVSWPLHCGRGHVHVQLEIWVANGHCKAARAPFADPPRRAMIGAERASASAAACPTPTRCRHSSACLQTTVGLDDGVSLAKHRESGRRDSRAQRRADTFTQLKLHSVSKICPIALRLHLLRQAYSAAAD